MVELRRTALSLAVAALLAPTVWAQSQMEGQTAEEQEAGRQARFDQLWSSADSAHERGDYSAAEGQYRAILEEFPRSQKPPAETGGYE